LNCRRQPNTCCGNNPWRRATAQTESPTVSATIRALSSSLQRRRRPLPVNTSSRRAGSVIALRSVSILSLTIHNRPQTWQIKPSAERWGQNDAYPPFRKTRHSLIELRLVRLPLATIFVVNREHVGDVYAA